VLAFCTSNVRCAVPSHIRVFRRAGCFLLPHCVFKPLMEEECSQKQQFLHLQNKRENIPKFHTIIRIVTIQTVMKISNYSTQIKLTLPSKSYLPITFSTLRGAGLIRGVVSR
jgi:hypothetical protein